MDLGLRDRVALVTGATRGIGRAIAEAPAAEGARVAVCGTVGLGVAAVADAIGGRGYVFGSDSDDLGAVDTLVDAVVADLAIDVYVVNIGGPPRFEDRWSRPPRSGRPRTARASSRRCC